MCAIAVKKIAHTHVYPGYGGLEINVLPTVGCLRREQPGSRAVRYVQKLLAIANSLHSATHRPVISVVANRSVIFRSTIVALWVVSRDAAVLRLAAHGGPYAPRTPVYVRVVFWFFAVASSFSGPFARRVSPAGFGASGLLASGRPRPVLRSVAGFVPPSAARPVPAAVWAAAAVGSGSGSPARPLPPLAASVASGAALLSRSGRPLAGAALASRLGRVRRLPASAPGF